MSKELINFIVNDENTKAEDEFENLMADKIREQFDKRKREIANKIFNYSENDDDLEEEFEVGNTVKITSPEAVDFETNYNRFRGQTGVVTQTVMPNVVAVGNGVYQVELETGQRKMFAEKELEFVKEDIDLLKDIVETKKDKTYEFKDGSSVEVDVQTASLLLIVYGSLDGSNKKKFEEKVYKSKKSFLELVSFAQKKIG